MATRLSRVSAASPPSSARVFAPTWQELGLLGLACLVSGLGVTWAPDVPRWVNYGAPILLSAGLGWGVWVTLRRERAAIWTALLWWRVVMIAYSGIGSMVPLWANDTTLDSLDSFFELFPGDLAKYNLVAAVFSLVLELSATVILLVMRSRAEIRESEARFPPCALTDFQFGMVAVQIGSVIALFVRWLPLVFGRSSAIPASLASLGMLSYVGYALLTYVAFDRRRSMLWWLFPLILFDSLSGVLTFSKLQALLPIIFAILGVLFHRPSMRRLGICAGLVVLSYLVLVPIVSFGRQQDWAGGMIRDASLARSVQLIRDYFNQGEIVVNTEEDQGAWQRLAYVGTGAFAISEYDNGRPSSTLQYALIVFIPRFIYKDKPTITDVYREFNAAATGNWNSSSSPGIPAEGYWTGGWGGVAVFAVILGVLWAAFSDYALRVIRSKSWHLLFVVLLAFYAAARIDGLMVSDVEAFLPLAVIAHYVLTFLNGMIVRRRAARAPLLVTGPA